MARQQILPTYRCAVITREGKGPRCSRHGLEQREVWKGKPEYKTRRVWTCSQHAVIEDVYLQDKQGVIESWANPKTDYEAVHGRPTTP